MAHNLNSNFAHKLTSLLCFFTCFSNIRIFHLQIIRVNQKVGKIPVEVYDVYFLGTQQRGTCSKNSIFRYSAEFKRKNAGMEKKQYGKRYLNALRIMEDELFHGKKFKIYFLLNNFFLRKKKKKKQNKKKRLLKIFCFVNKPLLL